MIKIDKLNPFGRLCITLGMLPTSYKESLTYEEQLLWLFNYIEKTLIPTINNNAQAVEELQALYIELKSYVDSYFDNLDVQEEINNKLDDMAESGQLEAIIGQYLSLAGILSYDTLTDLKAAENLIDGSICKTLGFASVYDRGGAFYKVREVTNQDVVDNVSIVALSDENLVAQIILQNSVAFEQFGIIGDGETENSTNLGKLLTYVSSNKINITTGGGVYYFNNNITLSGVDIDLNGGSLLLNNNTITLTNKASLQNGTIEHGVVILDGGRNRLTHITFKEFQNSAITINQNGFEDFIEYIRVENNSNSTSTVCITNNTGDETISHVTGFGCYKGIVTYGADNYYEDIHLWLNNNNTFADSIFAEIHSTSNVFSNCCSDSYNKPIYLSASNLKNTLTNFNFINNNILFKNKEFVLVSGTTTGCVLTGNVICKLTNFADASNNNTLSIGFGSELYFTMIDGGTTEKTGGFNYTWIQSKTTGTGVSVNDASSIYINAGKLNINLTLYISGSSTSEVTIDLSSLIDINRYKSRGFVPAVYNNYTTAGFVEYYLNNGTLTFSKPNQSSGSTFSAIGLNLYIEQ